MWIVVTFLRDCQGDDGVRDTPRTGLKWLTTRRQRLY